MSDPAAELQSNLRGLAIGGKGPVQDIRRPSIKGLSTSKPKMAKKPVADSWEDETETSDDEPTPQDVASPSSVLSPTISAEGPLDPPLRLSHRRRRNHGVPDAGAYVGWTGRPARRPEKQTAVASRLIAGALGIRAPKRTEEQRAYDLATKEQEIKRRNREREEQAKAKEEEERVKASVWTD
jgi:hypothetical protein